MPNKTQIYAQMADDTARKITGDYLDWAAFLNTSSIANSTILRQDDQEVILPQFGSVNQTWRYSDDYVYD